MTYAKRWSLIFGTETDWARTESQEKHPDRLLLQELVKTPVIDVGCGAGLDAEFYDDYIGIDVTPEFIKSAHENYGVERLVLCDARYLPFRDKVFETAFSKGVVIHYPQEEGEKMIDDMIRISNTTYIAWGIPLVGPGHGQNYIPTRNPELFISKSGFHVNRYDLTELEKRFEVYPQKEGTSVTLVKKRYNMKFRIKQSTDAGSFSMDWFNNIYGKINYKNQTVLDIGADWGRTPDLFLQKGAKKVIAVEGKKEWCDLLISNAKLISGIIPVFMWLENPSDISKLIEKYEPDIVKISTWPWCNCENWLLEIPKDIITSVSQYLLMTANRLNQRRKITKLENMFRTLDYDVKTEMYHVPLITAISKETKK